MTDKAALSVALRIQRGPLLIQAMFLVPDGVSVLLGPSGSGKSTTLDLIAGHLRPDAGRISGPTGPLFDGETGLDLPPRRRRIGYVMQEPSLFPHLSVLANVRYGVTEQVAKRRCEELIERFGLVPLLGRRPAALSGGERQRVALARALSSSPQLLLLDEPLSAIDGAGRQELLAILLLMLQAAPLPVLYVTHNEDEARLLGSRLLRCWPRSAPDAPRRIVEISADSC